MSTQAAQTAAGPAELWSTGDYAEVCDRMIPQLGARLVEITALANRHAPRGAREIFHDDDVKFHSCMTLFLLAAPQVPTFRTALDLFFDGRLDPRTEAILVAQDRERSPNSGPGERPARR